MSYVYLVPVIGLILWRRLRRQFGSQRIRRKAMILRIVVVGIFLALMLPFAVRDVQVAGGLLAGLAGGVLLGVVALRLTRFETDPDKGDCYIPNTWIGALLAVLLLGRLAYRFLVEIPEMQQMAAHAGGQPPAFVESPLTLVIIGLVMGYYLSYYAGLLVHHRRYQAAQSGAPGTGEG